MKNSRRVPLSAPILVEDGVVTSVSVSWPDDRELAPLLAINDDLAQPAAFISAVTGLPISAVLQVPVEDWAAIIAATKEL